MNRHKIQNTFGGLDTDTSVNKYSNERYIHSENFRTILNEENGGAALTNIRSSRNVVRFTRGTVNGIAEFFDKIVVITTTGTNLNIIYIIPKSHIDAVTDIPISIDIGGSSREYQLFRSARNFGFTPESKVKIVTRKETEQIQKIYFTDGKQPLRFINIADPNLNSYDDNKFLIAPDVVPGKATMEITSGSLRAGKVGYAYQLYNNYGAESRFIPVGELLDIYNSPLSEVRKIRGDSPETITGKGVRVNVRSIDSYQVTLIINNSTGIDPIGIINGEQTLTAHVRAGEPVSIQTLDSAGNPVSSNDITLNGQDSGYTISGGAITFNMPHQDVVIMKTLIETFKLNLEILEGQGSITEATGRTDFSSGENVRVTATPAENYEFWYWISPGITLPELIDNPYNPSLSFSMPSNEVTLKAIFASTALITLNIKIIGEGTIRYLSQNYNSDFTIQVVEGDEVNLNALGDGFLRWVSNTFVESMPNLGIIALNNLTIEALFTKEDEENGGGIDHTLSVNPTSLSFAAIPTGRQRIRVAWTGNLTVNIPSWVRLFNESSGGTSQTITNLPSEEDLTFRDWWVQVDDRTTPTDRTGTINLSTEIRQATVQVFQEGSDEGDLTGPVGP